MHAPGARGCHFAARYLLSRQVGYGTVGSRIGDGGRDNCPVCSARTVRHVGHMRFRFLLPLVAFLVGCDPGWQYQVSSKPSMRPASASTSVRVELVRAFVFSLGLHLKLDVINATTATIELESPVMTLRDASDTPLTPTFQEGCGPIGRGARRLAPSESCSMEARFPVDPGTWRANPRLRTLIVRIEAKIDGAHVQQSLHLERTFH